MPRQHGPWLMVPNKTVGPLDPQARENKQMASTGNDISRLGRSGKTHLIHESGERFRAPA